MDDRRIVFAGARVAGIAAALLAAGIWAGSWYPTFKAGREEARRIAPMMEEARRLNLDYDKVLSGGDAYIGKYVLWCVQNVSEDHVFFIGGESGRLAVSNYWEMPRFTGNKHNSCAEMLLNIEDVRKSRSGAGSVVVEFIYSREGTGSGRKGAVPGRKEYPSRDDYSPILNSTSPLLGMPIEEDK